MKVYISGPMTGLPNLNREAFEAAEKMLDRKKCYVANPHKIESPLDTYEGHMAADIRELTYCDAIYLLPGWSESRGAQAEFAVAKVLGLLVIDG
jgi:hypothetical protein